jgi:micrococcal nuclease
MPHDFFPRKGVWAIVLTVVAATLWGVSALAAEWIVRARYVPDGDTLFLLSGEKVRLEGIDCPELRHDGRPSQYYAREARNYLWRLVRGQDLCVHTRDIRADRFGRIVAPVYLPDGRSISLVLVENGYAFCYAHKKEMDSRQAALLAAQQRAMNRLRGMWARVLRMPAAGERYVGSRNSRRFHTLTCGFGRQISARNKVVFSDLRQAFYAGFAPCRSCTPWPDAK